VADVLKIISQTFSLHVLISGILLIRILVREAVSFWRLKVAQMVKNFPAFYGTRRFSVAFTRDRHFLTKICGVWGRNDNSHV
jgi:hypothetical protein